VGDDQLFYLMSRGLTEQQATAMIVNGFIEPITKTLPMEYARRAVAAESSSTWKAASGKTALPMTMLEHFSPEAAQRLARTRLARRPARRRGRTARPSEWPDRGQTSF